MRIAHSFTLPNGLPLLFASDNFWLLLLLRTFAFFVLVLASALTHASVTDEQFSCG